MDETIDELVEHIPEVPVDCVNRSDAQTLLRFVREIDEDQRAARKKL